MILVLKPGLGDNCIASVQEKLTALGLHSQPIRSAQRTLVVVNEDVSAMPSHLFSQLDGVDRVINISPRYPLCATENKSTAATLATIFGANAPVIVAGPCSVEGKQELLETAFAVKAAGARALRGGAFKPRTNPYDFSGLGQEGLEYLAHARSQTGLPVVSEVLSAQQIESAFDFVDVFQIGARNMYNYELLREVGRAGKPVLLKRAMSATIDELLQAAEYVLLEGNELVVLCERGIRTFETRTRNTLDLNAVALIKRTTQLPVFVDPSHGTGRSDLVRALSRAAIACGADGLLIETHCNPRMSISDSDQAITPDELKSIASDARSIYDILNNDNDIPTTALVPAQPAVLSLQHNS